MPTCEPVFQPKAESVGVVDLFAPGTAPSCVTSTGVTLPNSNVLFCKVNSRGAAPKPCAPRLVKLAATVATGAGGSPPTRTRLALAAPGKVVAAANNDSGPTAFARSRDANFMGILPVPWPDHQRYLENCYNKSCFRSRVKHHFLDEVNGPLPFFL